ncbi:hypothetical protein F511_29325 [Dorcoceras hygrometricum]|uniref:GBF-interacting protein 1 N-terminal domain-containing protein n=1 Tax=Dorcoceras hygrometricum TaxID=472368 RepID=A0A2Z7AA97_9LAMI|nr:hypothetical protein F511_29325 [Dorcoceras hygrometricum]
MNSIKGRSAGSGGGVQAIPSGSRKIVQSLKEIVNCSETEIYVALKDCNMDPNEAVNRLLCQDPFHEVKSKREKKKEGKDISDSRPRNATNSSSRGSKNVSDRFIGPGGLTSNNSYGESLPLLGKSSFKKDNESVPYTSSLSSVSRKYESTGSFDFSTGASAENEGPLLGVTEGMPSGVQPTSGCQTNWVGVPGQFSMADVVKMGRPPNKASNAAHTTQHNVQVPIVEESHQTITYSEDSMPKTNDSGVSSIQHVSTTDDWPSVETKTIPITECDIDFEQHQEEPCVPFDVVNRQSEADEFQETEDETSENPGSIDVGSLCISGKSFIGDDIRGSSVLENDLYEKMSSYRPQAHESEHLEAEGDDSVPSVTGNLQQLSIRTSDRGFPSEGDAPSVVIPDHLQSIPKETNLGNELGKADISSHGHSDTRNSEYFADDSLRNASDGSFSISNVHGQAHQSYDASAASQPEPLNPENAEVAHGFQYSFPASKPSHTFGDVQNLNVAYNQTSSQLENLTTFSNAMHLYTNSLSSTLLAANVHPVRESDIQYSPFSLTRQTSSRYGNSISSVGDSEISMSEALRTSDISSTHLGHQKLSGTSVATGPPLPQNLAVHPYSQPTLPLGPYGNMFGYPILPQSYTYMPSAFQQTFLGNSKSLAAMDPQYKNNASVSSLPQSAAIASGYGGFGNTTAIPGNFQANPPVTPSGTTLNYDDLLNSQYKDSNHLISLQQNGNSPIWLHGGNSRTMSTVPPNTYYSYQGQNQQLGGFKQGQQSSQNYGTVGHPNLYNSQTSMTLDHKNNSRDSAGSQGQLNQSQIWQSSY